MQIEKSLLERVKEKQESLDKARLEKYNQTLDMIEEKGLGEKLYEFKDRMTKCIELIDYCLTEGIEIDTHMGDKVRVFRNNDTIEKNFQMYNYGHKKQNTFAMCFNVEMPVLSSYEYKQININSSVLTELNNIDKYDSNNTNGIISKEDAFLRFTYNFIDIKNIILNIGQFPISVDMNPAETRKCIDEGLDEERINEHIYKLEKVFEVAKEYDKFITDQLEKWLGNEDKDKETVKNNEIDEIERE